jgi:hypothetical protein
MLDIIDSIAASTDQDILIKEYLWSMQTQIAPLSEKEIRSERGYVNVCFYPPSQNHPSIKILRHISYYVDGAIGIQDEIYLNEITSFWQYNFEISQHKMIIKNTTYKLEEALAEIQKLSLSNGSTIMIQCFPDLTKVAFNGNWISQKDFDAISLPASN